MIIRDPSDPPGIPVVPGGAYLARFEPPAPRCAPCPDCGAWALVLADGAARPYCFCYTCYTCAPAPAPSHWRVGRPAQLNCPRNGPQQMGLF
ncbi:MAG: hypothetical protein R3C14_40555 [Caldilineaceae bacterium]